MAQYEDQEPNTGRFAAEMIKKLKYLKNSTEVKFPRYQWSQKKIEADHKRESC